MLPEVKIIKEFGEKHNWPAIVLQRDGDTILKKIGAGKDIWRNVVDMSKLKYPYNATFLELLDSVKRGDICQEKE